MDPVQWLLASEAFKYTPSAAAIEAQGVKHNRILNVVTTLDKIKYCLRNQVPRPFPPHSR